MSPAETAATTCIRPSTGSGGQAGARVHHVGSVDGQRSYPGRHRQRRPGGEPEVRVHDVEAGRGGTAGESGRRTVAAAQLDGRPRQGARPGPNSYSSTSSPSILRSAAT